MLTDSKKPTKMLGSQIDEDLFWEFKKVMASRKEKPREAMEHAINLYIEIDDNENEEAE